MSIVVNLFAGPGAGKSTLAAGIFFELKTAGVNCELVREYAKRKVWEGNNAVFENQAYIFGKQSYETQYTSKGVDVIVTDSPILLSALYNSSVTLGDQFNNVVLDVFNSYDNMNYFIERTKPYNPAGRFQDEAAAKVKDEETKELLAKYNVPYMSARGDRFGLYEIVSDVLIRLGKKPLYCYTNSCIAGSSFMVADYELPLVDEGENTI